jgi:coenzyme F420-reducing hydrogenase beta subunit/polysaccharide pyruvyl transferase WcaK-like protein
MLTSNFINYFEEISGGGYDYYVYLTSDDDVPRLKDSVTIPDHVHKLPYDFEKTATAVKKIHQIGKDYIQGKRDMRQLKPAAVVVLGGDSLSEVYLGAKSAYYLIRFLNMSKHAPVFLLSQTIGPYHSWRKGLAKKCFDRCQIYTRDQWTIDYLKNEIGFEQAHKACDLAFLELKDQPKRSGTLEGYGLTPENYITLVPSGLYQHYTNTYEDYITAWINTLKHLLNLEALAGNKLVLLAHVHDADRQDKRKLDKHIIFSIMEQIGKQYHDRLTPVTEEIMPSEARIILGNGRFTVTGRMHSAISTFQMLKPAIALSYSPKYKGVIGDELGRNDLVIESQSDNIWSSGTIAQALETKVLYTLEHYDRLLSDIRAKMPAVKQKALSQLQHMVAFLKEHHAGKTIEHVISQGSCHGCASCVSSCAHQALSLTIDESQGIYVPRKSPAHCTECGLCDDVCPVINDDFSALAQDLYGTGKFNPMTGYYRNIHVGYSNQDSVRFECSSGGLLTQTLLYLFETKQIDGAIVASSAKTDPLHPQGILATSAKEIYEGRGSKYCPVPLNIALKELRNSHNNQRFAYAGLPCQIRGMRRQAQKQSNIAKHITYVFGIVCGRTLTFKATEKLFTLFDIQAEQVESLTYRGHGWPGSMLVNGKEVAPLRTYYRQVNNARFIHPACRFCTDVFAELADACFGDAWLGKYTSEPNAGTSICLTRSAQTEALFQEMAEKGVITLKPSGLKELCYSQASVILKKKKAIFGPLYKCLGFKDASLKTAAYLIKSILRG